MFRQLFIKNAFLQGPNGINGNNGTNGVAVLGANVADSAALNNITAATPFSLSFTIAANTLQVGKVLRATGAGTWSVTGAQTLSLYAAFGASAKNNLNYVLAATNTGWWEMQADLIIRTIGGAGTASLKLRSIFRDTATAGPQANTIVTDVSIDSTAANVVTFQMASTVGANSFVQLEHLLEQLN